METSLENPHMDDKLYYTNYQSLPPSPKLVVPIPSTWVQPYQLWLNLLPYPLPYPVPPSNNFAALFVLNYRSREFPLSAVADRFELRCQSKAADAIVLQRLVPVFVYQCFLAPLVRKPQSKPQYLITIKISTSLNKT